MAAFEQLFVSAGVDEERQPRPGMIVPLNGFNVVRLTGGKDRQVPPPPPPLELEELSFSDVGLASLLLNPGGALKPAAIGDSRYFKISSKVPVSPDNPVKIEAVGKFGSASLDVAVVKPKTVKLSIRPVMTRGPLGVPVLHSQETIDADAMKAVMNSIWTPQANVVFKLVSSLVAPIMDKKRIAKAMGVSEDDGVLPEMVNIDVFKDILVGLKDADLTMFLVKQVSHSDNPGVSKNWSADYGWTKPELGISLISDRRTSMPELLAHEAGHFLYFQATGNMGHIGGGKDLMQSGGSPVARVRFDHVKLFNRQ